MSQESDDATTEVFYDEDNIQISEYDDGKIGYLLGIKNVCITLDRETLDKLFEGVCVTGLKLQERDKTSVTKSQDGN